jgi:hypothetical protein
MLLGQLRKVDVTWSTNEDGCYLDTNAANVAWTTNTGAMLLGQLMQEDVTSTANAGCYLDNLEADVTLTANAGCYLDN